MKTQAEIEKIKFDISEKISKYQERLTKCKDEFTYNLISTEIKTLMGQYNILLEVLNG